MLWAALLLLAPCLSAQPGTFVEDGLLEGLSWRNIGPHRGGRCVAIAGIPGAPYHFYMGTTGGGIWETRDGGITWNNISDGFLNRGSIGAIAVAPSDPNIIYAGTGEHPVRGVMTSAGDGVYRSDDGGKTWQHLGLKGSRHIADIQIHPQNPDQVWVAVQGAVHGPSEMRGIYYSANGGLTWQQTLFVNETTGASSLSLDRHNPRILYAGLWDHQRSPWQIRSGGPGSGLYRSTDGGLNWEVLDNGLPTAMGKTGIAVSPADPARVYAIIEAEKGGLYRSDDQGESWTLINSDRVGIARAWYYTEIVADPADPETVYVLNAPLLKSTDGGKTLTPIPNPHTDQHALWVNPEQPHILALANDGGATLSYNGGISWSAQDNQPTAQLYRLALDNQFPYRIYAGQQDNSTLSIPSRTQGAGISSKDWYPVAGGESAFIALDPNKPGLVYGGSYLGNLSVYDHQTGQETDIMAYPVLGLAQSPREARYRFNWNAPLIMPLWEPGVLYHGANKVLRSEDGGVSWEEISPDLTRNNTKQQGPGGIPYTNEGAGGEAYHTLSYLAASPREQGVIWAGADDGLVHLSQDGGATWQEVTPPAFKEQEALINCIEPSPHRPGSAFLAVTRYKFDDFEPLAYVTEDYGKTWSRITTGIRGEDFVRTVREDPVREGLLYAGTEHGLYLSFDRGQRWLPFQLNLPRCPITDLAVKGSDLIAATSGRSIWILDGLEPLRQLDTQSQQQAFLFDPAPTVRYLAASSGKAIPGLGQNPANGMQIGYFLPDNLDSAKLTLEIRDDKGQLVRSYSNQKTAAKPYPGGPPPKASLTANKGLNIFYWDLRHEPLPGVPDAFILGNYAGYLAAPGSYTLTLTTPYGVLTAGAEIVTDPRLNASYGDYEKQQAFLKRATALALETQEAVAEVRGVAGQLKRILENLKSAKGPEELIATGEALLLELTTWETNIIQPRQETFQDVINYPNRLAAELMNLKGRFDTPAPSVTLGAQQRLLDLEEAWSTYATEKEVILQQQAQAFNKLYAAHQLPAILLPGADER